MSQGVVILAAGRVRSMTEKNDPPPPEKPTAPKTQHEFHSTPAIETTSKRRATKYVPCVRPYSPASIDPGFVEIGLVQLSQSTKTTNVPRTDIIIK